MARKDKIKIRILENGRIVAVTDKISMKNHIEAASALKELTDLLGGEEEIESTKTLAHHHHHYTGDHHTHGH